MQKKKMASCFFLLLVFLQLHVYGGLEVLTQDPTEGFISLTLNSSNFQIQKPYDKPVSQRYSFIDGVHKLWVYSTDKPHSKTSTTLPRTEIRIQGYDYSSGIWQFEGYTYVPTGTSGVCIMQIFGGDDHHATTLMLRVYDGQLKYYQQNVLADNMYNKWMRVNVIHDVELPKVKVFIDGVQKLETDVRDGNKHFFKFGVYAQDHMSDYMESRWKGIKVLKKSE